MGQLSAFVGHSFLEADELVVSRILRMLESISKLMPDFEWDHALAAEPKVLSQKVKEKMKGKNLFIGICTAKERAIDPANLRRRPWTLRDDLVAERSKFQPKTSDWIIQEIGMAVGRDMQIVLLVEAGLREPGGLQGDLEYIPFDRSQPEKCFEKLADMLRSLAPLAAKVGETQQSVAPMEAAGPENTDDPMLEFLTPSASWTAEVYANTYRIAIAFRQERAERQIMESFNKSAFADDAHAQAAFQSAGISARADVQKGEWVTPLRKLAKQYPNTAGPYSALAKRFEEISDHALAAENYEIAAQFATTASKKMRLLIDAAEQSHKAGKTEQAERFISQSGEVIVSNPDVEADGMARLADFWKVAGNTEMFTACAERALELAPDSTHPRFDLAYKYSETNLENHALFHYRQYLKVRDNPDAWNNLGVSAVASKLPITGVEAYREADKAGNTLATSNLAFALLEAGFLAEATALCEEGLKRPEPHPRLLEAKARCDRVRPEEGEKEAQVLETTTLRRTVLRTVGHSSIRRLATSVHEKWRGPNCEFTATVVDSQLTLKGSYSRRIGPGLGELLLGKQGETERRFTIVYTGSLIGHSFVGKVKTTSDTATASLLGADEARECIGTLNQTLTLLELLENNKDRTTLSAVPAG